MVIKTFDINLNLGKVYALSTNVSIKKINNNN